MKMIFGIELFYKLVCCKRFTHLQHKGCCLQIVSPTAHETRGFVTGQMFNRKGEVLFLYSFEPYYTYISGNDK